MQMFFVMYTTVTLVQILYAKNILHAFDLFFAVNFVLCDFFYVRLNWGSLI